VAKFLVRGVGAMALAVAMLFGAAAGAHSAVGIAPDRGPVAGGTTVAVPSPPGVTFTSISAGKYHSLALGSDHNVYAWGLNIMV